MTRITTTIRTTAGLWFPTLAPLPRQLLSLAAERQAVLKARKRPVPNPFAARMR